MSIAARDNELIISGEKAEAAESAVLDMIWTVDRGAELDGQRVELILSVNREGRSLRSERIDDSVICFTHAGKPVRAKTHGQASYIQSISRNDVVFGVGPAGTGKTYLAVAMAVRAYKDKEVEKIILARPAVEAGESLGFLPGDLQEKVDPYLRPLYDALYDILGRDIALRLKEKEIIEVIPLAYMRGRTLDSSFVILDEAQNTTREQMKMFLTRLGFGSKAVITGDITQIDLPKKKLSGLKDAMKVLKGVQGIAFSRLGGADVVRHPLVKRIIEAYDRASENPEQDNKKQNGK